MEEDFQDGKIRQTESRIGYASRIDLSEGSIGFHQNEPNMDTGSVAGAGFRIAHSVIFISRYFAGKFFFRFDLRIDVNANDLA